MEQAKELDGLIRSSGWRLDLLAVVRDEAIPEAWIGAGAARDLVRGERFGSGFEPSRVRDGRAATPGSAVRPISRERHRAGSARAVVSPAKGT